MTIVPAALAIIKGDEGCRLTPYRDANGVLTVGYGHTGADVNDGVVWTQAQADAALESDLKGVDDYISSRCPKATPEQHGALCSLAYNIGTGNFHLSKVYQYHQLRQWGAAASAFMEWNREAGQVARGLVKRRAQEITLYCQTVPV